MAWLTGYTRRRKISIDQTNVDADLTNFTAYVPLNSDVVVGANIDSGGLNIRFTAADGTTLLKYERKLFSVTGSAATGTFYVKVPTVVGAADTDIYCYFKSGATTDGEDVANAWDANWIDVFHFDEASGSAVSSISGGRTATLGGNATRATGKVGNGLSVDGAGDFAVIASPSIGNLPVTGTTEVWFKPATNYTAASGRVDLITRTFGPYLLYDYVNGKLTYVVYNSASAEYQPGKTMSLASGTWYYAAGVHTATAVLFYLNAVQEDSQVADMASPKATASALGIGSDSATTGFYFNGIIDEIRFSSVARSPEWLKFTYHNINEPDNELSWAAEEVQVTGPLPQPWSRLLLLTPEEHIPAATTPASGASPLLLSLHTQGLFVGGLC